ncbi:EAL and modified HD-GYP domain-containing signal transduction protein [Pseudoduganella lurida]|uniref:EAL and modified HD-GYP domain-containing signal transduction protein n=1 Tax=Pseudoduganella lurida TaxID=1036180 RepID=A0A562RNL8_9BURK|nr:HDOD domain-containing protein [Pseudoduganella lurida]TWI70174.1 EAL and modified HD-GYP domain-containing signal transduction protein [Pseudoduganella lurida]
MSETLPADESTTFPLAGLEAVTNALHDWVAVAFHAHPAQDAHAALLALFAHPGTLDALAPLDCILPLHEPLRFVPAQHAVLPARRVMFRVPAAALDDAAVRKHCAALAEEGYRLFVDGEAGVHATEAGMRAVTCAVGVPSALSLLGLPGPHWARQVDDAARLILCRAAGMQWFSGKHARQPGADNGDSTSRRRLLSLLGLLARDADSRELEQILKQDPALAYHLLKLVNSAQFGYANPIHNFGQAINMLGRRQLQRWLQLLLYARSQQDGPGNPLLPLAAIRAAQMEALCALQGGDRDRQDMAFVVGVFALLDELLGMPMAEVVAALNLDPEVAGALLDRSGPFGALLAVVEANIPDAGRIAALGLTNEQYWDTRLQGWRWAIQVNRNL